MVQPIDIISRALKDIGALEAGETPTPDAAQDAFDMFNDMLDQWSNESMMVYYKTEIIFPITSGQTQYTIGPGGQMRGDLACEQRGRSGAVVLPGEEFIPIAPTRCRALGGQAEIGDRNPVAAIVG